MLTPSFMEAVLGSWFLVLGFSAKEAPSQVSVETYLKTLAEWRKCDEAKKKALGLDQPDPVLDGIAGLLALSFADSPAKKETTDETRSTTSSDEKEQDK